MPSVNYAVAVIPRARNFHVVPWSLEAEGVDVDDDEQEEEDVKTPLPIHGRACAGTRLGARPQCRLGGS